MTATILGRGHVLGDGRVRIPRGRQAAASRPDALLRTGDREAVRCVDGRPRDRLARAARHPLGEGASPVVRSATARTLEAGMTEAAVYIVGRTSGGWAGLKTEVVET